ncbi:ribose 5-phosphate isomerase B [Helicobacter sp. MIT 99-5507]|uniref:ribose 5-phosphate isomerase B n=1 Tax=Helicobacter sp. MIT 99-5507 TaxID=152489 RepID=UPI000E1F760F|nr:ribose 5-phosphate isomerase B [Helicobacter sp. MIT 99-5507]RDU56691.1 ribose 5-phosphate isomerase B [Helicobacter sp. MIT 99-5507]
MTCVIGCDHAGLRLAYEVIDLLSNMDNVDKIVEIIPQDSTKVDYPDFAALVCKEVANKQDHFGILICGSGIGMSICANKISGIRAALCVNEYMARYARLHNDANVLCLGERLMGFGIARDVVNIFLNTKFEAGRHKLRVDKVNALL